MHRNSPPQSPQHTPGPAGGVGGGMGCVLWRPEASGAEPARGAESINLPLLPHPSPSPGPAWSLHRQRSRLCRATWAESGRSHLEKVGCQLSGEGSASEVPEGGLSEGVSPRLWSGLSPWRGWVRRGSLARVSWASGGLAWWPRSVTVSTQLPAGGRVLGRSEQGSGARQPGRHPTHPLLCGLSVLL